MKVLGLSGSPRQGSNTDILINEVLNGAKSKGATTSFINFSKSNINGCVSCMYCRKNIGCSQKDDMQHIYDEIQSADFIIFGTPVYMGQVTAQFKAMMDRLFPYMNTDFTSKINKPSMFVYSQNAHDAAAFKPYFNMTTNALSVLGFKTKETYVITDGNMPAAVSERKEILNEMFNKGSELVS